MYPNLTQPAGLTHLAHTALLCLLVGGSANAAPTDPASRMSPVTVLFESNACGDPGASLKWITDAAGLEAMRASLASPGLPTPPLPAIDTAAQTVLWISMGTQPTPGYRVSPAAELPATSGDTLTIPMRWSQPPAGLMLPQVITTPCLLFSVANGDYKRVEITDQDGQSRLTATRP